MHGIRPVSVGFVAAVALLTGSSLAADASLTSPEDNLLNNPEFATTRGGRLVDWDPNRETSFRAATRVENGALVFAATNAAVALRQGDIQLAEGAKYRLGLWVKTRNFKPGRCSAIVYNWAWTAEGGVSGGFPEDTHGEWVKLEKEFVAPKSRMSLYVFTVYVRDNPGELAIRSPYLVPADEAAKAGAVRAPREAELAGVGRRLLAPKPAPCSQVPERRLNSLVTRLKSGTAQPGTVAFSAPRDGWIWISLEKGGANTRVDLDGREVVRFRPGERFETMRRVTSGDHTLRFVGTTGGTFVVNAIPQIFAYAYPRTFRSGTTWIQEGYRPFQGEEFRTKCLYGFVNTFNYGYGPGSIPAEDFADLRGRGIEMVQLCGPWGAWCKGFDGHLQSVDGTAARLLAHGGQTWTNYCGTAFDEIDIGTVKEKWFYAQALRKMKDAPRPHYTWSSGCKFVPTPLNAEYLSACLDVSGGRGRFLFECYPRPPATEAEAEAYLDDFVNDPVRRAKRLLPGCEDGLLVIMGLYNLFVSSTYNPSCATDTKRFYDLYLHRLATHPDFVGLAGTGLYAYEHGTEEDVRWIARLFRHYCLEGRTSRLSDDYGYAYAPAHVANGDFAKGLAGWTVEPATDGAVEARTVTSWGRKALRISGKSEVGDTAAVFRRSEKGVSFLRTKVAGLKPGALYAFKYAVGDVRALKQKEAPTPRSFGIAARVVGAAEPGDLPLDRYGLREHRNAFCNFRVCVFRATASDAELVFSDADAENGAELAVNAVSVAPYFAGL